MIPVTEDDELRPVDESGGREADLGEGVPPPDGDSAAADAAGTPVDAEAALAQLRAEKKEYWDRLIRVSADLDNFRKRSRREAQDAMERGREEVLREILPVADNLERAIAHAENPDADGSALLEGLRMVQRQLLIALERFDIRPFDAIGKKFDPEFHEALQQEDSDAEPATVIRELQRGYRQGSRVIRPAMVVVARSRGATPLPAESNARKRAADNDAPDEEKA